LILLIQLQDRSGTHWRLPHERYGDGELNPAHWTEFELLA